MTSEGKSTFNFLRLEKPNPGIKKPGLPDEARPKRFFELMANFLSWADPHLGIH